MSLAQTKLLHDLYYSPQTGLQSEKVLYAKAKVQDDSITHRVVKQFLSTQSTSQVFKPQRIKHYFPIHNNSYARFNRFQIDLIDLSNELPGINKGFKWLFVAIDVYSRYVFAYAQKNKSLSECLKSLHSLFTDSDAIVSKSKPTIRTRNQANAPPVNLKADIKQIDSDSEASFLSKSFTDALKSRQIHLNISDSHDKHSTGIVERFIRTFRTLFEKYKVAFGKHDWVNVYKELIDNYNHTVHSTLNDTPFDLMSKPTTSKATNARSKITTEQIELAKTQIYAQQPIDVGSQVRLRIIRSKFDKGTKPIFTKTIHKIESVTKDGLFSVSDRVNPYRINDLQLVERSENYTASPVEDVTEDSLQSHAADASENLVNRRVNRRLNKTGVNQPENIITDPNSRKLRQYKPRTDLGFMLNY